MQPLRDSGSFHLMALPSARVLQSSSQGRVVIVWKCVTIVSPTSTPLHILTNLQARLGNVVQLHDQKEEENGLVNNYLLSPIASYL